MSLENFEASGVGTHSEKLLRYGGRPQWSNHMLWQP